MAVVTVMNLRTGEKQEFTCSPQEAVIAAYAQGEKHDFNTWDYQKRYSWLLEHGEHTVACGDYSAYECECHPHDFRDWKKVV